MELPEPVEPNEISIVKNQLKKNFSDSDIYSRQLSITSDADVDENLHIVGFKVTVGSDAYSFNLGKAPHKSSDVLTIVADSKQLQLASDDPGENLEDGMQSKNNVIEADSENESFNPGSDTEEQIPAFSNMNPQASCSKESSTPQKASSKPITEGETSSTTTQTDQEFESSTAQTSRSDVQQLRNIQTTVVQTDRTQNVCSTAPDEVEMDSFEEQTDEVWVKQAKSQFESSTVQTSRLVQQPRSTQTTMVQTDRTQNVYSTTPDEAAMDSVKVQADGIRKKQAAVQAEKEKNASFAQTETADEYSVGMVYDASSTSIKKREDIGTSTSFDVYVIDRENLIEKSVGTEDLPFTPLIVAETENADIARECWDDKYCSCFCGHRNHQRCIYKCCIHKDYENIIPKSPLCKNNHATKLSKRPAGCNYCHCPPRYSCSDNNTCNSMFRMDLHQPHCCKCVNLQIEGVQSKASTKAETKGLKLPESIKISKMKFGPLAQQGNTSNRSKVEVTKNIKSGLVKYEVIIAARIFKCRKVERVSVLKVPVIFEHFLKSFNLSLYRSFRVVVNPVKISLTLDEQAMFRKQKDGNSKKIFFKDTKGRKETIVSWKDTKTMSLPRSCTPEVKMMSLPPSCTPEMKMMSLPPSCTPEVKKTYEAEKSPFNPWSKSYLNDQRVAEIESFSQSVSEQCNVIRENNAKTSGNHGRTTSPKIKHRGFDYISKDKWKPHHPKRDDILVKKLESTHITLVGQSSSEECFERAKNMFLKDACETVNDHLLSLRFVDENTVRAAAEKLHKQWFEVAGTKQSDVQQVRYYMQYFEEFSNNLLRTLLYSVDNNGNNVLHFAFANNRFDLVEEFLNNGFAVNLLNKTNKIGNTPLMICSISQPKSISEWSTVRKALEMGDINAKSKKSGQTALMNASSSGFHTMVNMLLDLGANPNVQDKDGSTALMYAAEHGHEKCIKSLIKHKKCDPTMQDKDGQTACSIALCNNHKNIAVLIHMKALEKRRFSKNLYASQRYIWTNNVKASKMKALSMMTRCLR